MPALTLNFEGIQDLNSVAPSDSNGAVGPNHYVQIVNLDVAVFDKSGNVLVAPKANNTLWTGFGGACETQNDGDPIVLYDRAADRFVISQFATTDLNNGPYLMCLAVSQTADPTGAYYRYSFSYTSFPDYAKLGVWPDAYYLTMNLYARGVSFAGAQVCALDRANMLIGAAATQQCLDAGLQHFSLLPADVDGATAPPAGSPNYLLELGTDNTSLDLWKFHVDWITPANSTLTATRIPVSQFSRPCDCIPQASPGNLLASLGDRLMYRLAYRNFGDHESLVANHSVVANLTVVGVRWYELRSPSGTPTVFQQGTYAPDDNYRWMGSIAMDQAGDMALGFSLSSSTLFPEIRYTGRLAGDALGQMAQGESIIVSGTGSESGNFSNGQKAIRWGDYSSMSVDPADDCTFWYTNQYYASNSSTDWHTRIGTFKFAGCAPPDFNLSASPASQTVIRGQSTSYTVTVTPSGGFNSAVTFKVSGLPTGASGTFSPNPSSTGSATLNITTLASTPTGTRTLTISGTSGSLAHTTTTKLVVTKQPTTTTVTSSLNPSNYGQTVTFNATVSSAIGTPPDGDSVVFKNGSLVMAVSPLTGGVANFTTNSLSGGSHLISAIFQGDATFASSKGTVTQSVKKVSTTTQITSSMNPSTSGQSVTFTATVTSGVSTPTGTVVFKSGTTVLGSGTLSSGGVATFTTSTLPVGSDPISATYTGSTNFLSSHASLTQTVNP